MVQACPDREWRLIFALSRYGGLRCPSEHLLLKLSDVDWDRNRIQVTSPKTEHHDNMGTRWVPIFPELKPFLTECWDTAIEGQFYFITRYRDPKQNLRSGLLRIIKAAGLVPWPKLFHNLRATRQTELANDFPAHVVCAWLGNSRQVAAEHYLQVTEDHFEQAAKVRATESATCTPSQEVVLSVEENFELADSRMTSQDDACHSNGNGRNRARTCDFCNVKTTVELADWEWRGPISAR